MPLQTQSLIQLANQNQATIGRHSRSLEIETQALFDAEAKAARRKSVGIWLVLLAGKKALNVFRAFLFVGLKRLRKKDLAHLSETAALT
jgi:hypothetical protein